MAKQVTRYQSADGGIYETPEQADAADLLSTMFELFEEAMTDLERTEASVFGRRNATSICMAHRLAKTRPTAVPAIIAALREAGEGA